MGNSSNKQPEQQLIKEKTPNFDQSLNWLLQTQITISQSIACKPEKCQFVVNCPGCRCEQFNDGLERRVNCYRCQQAYIVRQEVIQITSGPSQTNIDEFASSFDEVNKHLDDFNRNYPELTIQIYVNERDNVPNQLIQMNGIDFKAILSNIVIPFFAKHQRFITQGAIFNIGQQEFKVMGSSPMYGLVGETTEIYLYNSYSNAENLLSVLVAPLKKQPISNHQVYNDLMRNFIQNPKKNNLVQDQVIKLQLYEVQILKINPNSGKFTSETKVELMQEPLKEVNHLKILCKSYPEGLNQFTNIKSLEKAILKTVIIPYYTGMTKYVEQGSIIQQFGFTFMIEVPEGKGIVIPFKTQISLTIITQQTNQITALSPRIPHIQVEEESKSQIQQVIQAPNMSQPLVVQGLASRFTRSGAHLQQIEALRELLNTFIMLNEHQDLQSLEMNQGASEAMINRLPEREINLKFLIDKNFQDTDHFRCLICLTDYLDADCVRTMPCLHYFHSKCLDSWLVKNQTCPICKTSCDQQYMV